MPQIIPIKDLKNTNAISQMCQEADGPIFITKNGYGNMIIMSMENYRKPLFINDVYAKISESEDDFKNGRTMDAYESLAKLRRKYDA